MTSINSLHATHVSFGMMNRRQLFQKAALGVAAIGATKLDRATRLLAQDAPKGNLKINKAAQTATNMAFEEIEGPHEATPGGVPATYSWVKKPAIESAEPPEGWTGLSSATKIFLVDGKDPVKGVKLEIAGLKAYAKDKETGNWLELQAPRYVDGKMFSGDYSKNKETKVDRFERLGGVLKISSAPSPEKGYHFLCWGSEGRGSVVKIKDLGPVTVTAQVRLSGTKEDLKKAQGTYIAFTGADWFKKEEAENGEGNKPVGTGKGKILPADGKWVTVTFTTATSKEE